MKKYIPWVIVSSWLVFFLVLVFVLPSVSQANEANGLLESIDTNFSFSIPELINILTDYGVEGRAYYILQRWTFDLYYPLVYGVPISISLFGLLGKTPYKRIAWTGMLAASFDYLENIVFTIAAATFPNATPVWVSVGVVFSIAKWTILGGGFLLIFVLLLLRLIQKKRG